MPSPLHPVASLSFLALASALAALPACTVETKEVTAPPPAASSETPSEPPAETPSESKPAEAPAPPKDLDRVVFSGQFASVDLVYDRVSRFLVLDMKGEASQLTSSDPSVGVPLVTTVTESTDYELLYPQLGGCDKPPKLTFEGTTIKVALSRGGEPNATISGCYYLAQGVRATDGGFQARLTNLTLRDGRKVKELLVDLKGPAR